MRVRDLLAEIAEGTTFPDDPIVAIGPEGPMSLSGRVEITSDFYGDGERVVWLWTEDT